MSKSVAIIQARMSSSRLPGKVLEDLAGMPVLAWVCRAANAIPGIDEVIVATSVDQSDDPLAEWCGDNDVKYARGSLDDVLGRFIAAADECGAGAIMRLTGDCPFLDPWLAGLVLELQRQTGCDYASNANCGTWPDGLDIEVISEKALRATDSEALDRVEREHVTSFITARQMRFSAKSLPCPVPGIGEHRWTLDSPEDLTYLRAVAQRLPKDRPPHMMEVLYALRTEPEIFRTDQPARNESYPGVLPAQSGTSMSFDHSQELYRRALETIPVASQTFSKSALQLPEGRSPLFATHGQGGRIWDVDGNEYVDMVCGLLAVSIGYCDPVIDDAIRDQLARGISYSLPNRLEFELSERIVETLPCAESVRFGKNGSDVTSAAIRIARAYTGRERIIACGYHGWHDWYIGATTRDKGVPEAVRKLTDRADYNDLTGLEDLFDRHPGSIAAVILEPAAFDEPKQGYLEGVRELTRRHGSVLIFDEIITGYRFSLGGAQEMFGVTPDLACVGKGLGNGLPLSAVAGKKELMREVEDIFFSGTFGGEALSLAAGIAVIDLMRKEPVIDTLWSRGEKLATGIRKLIAAEKLGDVFELKGWSPWTLLAVETARGQRSEAIRTLFIREMIAAGVLTLGSNNICYRHTDADIGHTLSAYAAAFGIIAAELDTGALEKRLGHAAIEPIFQVRSAS